MNGHVLAVAVLLGVAVLLALLCAVGVLVMENPLRKLNYIAPVATLSAVLVTVAVFLSDAQKQAGLKVVVITFLLCLINGVVTHATARAARIRTQGDWRPAPGEQLPLVQDRAGPDRTNANGREP